MPFLIHSLRLNRTVYVEVERNTVRTTVSIRNQAVVHSDIITDDMRTQAKMKYIAFGQVDKLPDEPVEPSTPVTSFRAVEYFTEDELMSLRVKDLREIGDHFGVAIDEALTKKKDIVPLLLAARVPKE